MDKIKNADTPEPLLEFNEFEAKTESILDLAKKEASGIIQEAKDKVKEIIHKEKQDAVRLEKQYLEKIEEEISIEKEKLIQRAQEQLQHIESIPDEKIRQAVSYVLDKVIPISQGK